MDPKDIERSFNFNLINFVKENDVLFNMNNSGYKDYDLKTQMFKKFADENNMDVQFVMKRWINLRNSYQRVKRELRENPNKKSRKVWAYKDKMSFLEINEESLSNSPFCHQAKKPKNEATTSSQTTNVNNSKIGENEYLCFTQTLNTYEDDLTDEDDEGTELTANSFSTFNNSVAALNNNNELNQERLNLNSDVLVGLNYLNENVKKLIKQHNNQFQTPQTIKDNISLYLDTLRPLLKMFANDALKFAKLQTKINQLIINEIEANQLEFNLV